MCLFITKGLKIFWKKCVLGFSFFIIKNGKKNLKKFKFKKLANGNFQ